MQHIDQWQREQEARRGEDPDADRERELSRQRDWLEDAVVVCRTDLAGSAGAEYLERIFVANLEHLSVDRMRWYNYPLNLALADGRLHDRYEDWEYDYIVQKLGARPWI